MARPAITLALGVLAACGTAAGASSAPPSNVAPPTPRSAVPSQVTIDELRGLIGRGALRHVDLEPVDVRTHGAAGTVHGEVVAAPGAMTVTSCGGRPLTFFEDERGRVHVAFNVRPDGERLPQGALMPGCVTFAYELAAGQRAGWHLEVVAAP